ncbi:AzlD domain-containing protein [Paenibacillus wulumuqiensis]|uniref:AzlD domain-containing protein n=1 Tax=Paenibacillus wulumuqiensis TaxID=1567107 RepID=UPI0006193CBF|nr:AzlD domain-containing protein [Paenibacillus wulumuqiensis]
MTIQWTTLMVIIGCALVTMIPRVLPFIVVRNLNLPESVLKWLSYIPVCILTALVVESLLIQNEDSLQIDWQAVIVFIPTLVIAIKTRSLSITVIAGVIMMALVRYFF